MLSVIMISVFILSVNMLSDIKLSVVAPDKGPQALSNPDLPELVA